MASHNNDEIISIARPHTIKKFELIESYVKAWAQKLLQNPYCNSIVYIDCMSNSGIYKDINENRVLGSPIRVARTLRDAAGQYPSKKIFLYFNDNSPEKIALLKENLPTEKGNFRYSITCKDGNALLAEISANLNSQRNLHYFLLYDPYEAAIDWDALAPFFQHWGEILINHMLHDPVRAITSVKRPETKKKYENTYWAQFGDLMPLGSDKRAYEERVFEIIASLKKNPAREFYVSSFPFFSTTNFLMYDLIHCTSNIEGFKLYKSTAWKVFGGKSSAKNTHGRENLFSLDLSGSGEVVSEADEYCYYIKDIADYLQSTFDGISDVPLDMLWSRLDEHPVFPSDGFKREIKDELKRTYGARVGRSTISFLSRSHI